MQRYIHICCKLDIFLEFRFLRHWLATPNALHLFGWIPIDLVVWTFGKWSLSPIDFLWEKVYTLGQGVDWDLDFVLMARGLHLIGWLGCRCRHRQVRHRASFLQEFEDVRYYCIYLANLHCCWHADFKKIHSYTYFKNLRGLWLPLLFHSCLNCSCPVTITPLIN